MIYIIYFPIYDCSNDYAENEKVKSFLTEKKAVNYLRKELLEDLGPTNKILNISSIDLMTQYYNEHFGHNIKVYKIDN